MTRPEFEGMAEVALLAKSNEVDPRYTTLQQLDDKEVRLKAVGDRDFSCKDCGACCTVFDRIEFVPELDEDRLTNHEKGDVLLNLAEANGFNLTFNLIPVGRRCPMIAVNAEGQHCGCGIYEARPEACRVFEPDSSGCIWARFEVWKRGADDKQG